MKDVEADLRIEREWRERLQVNDFTKFVKPKELFWKTKTQLIKPKAYFLESFVQTQKYDPIQGTDFKNDNQESAVIDKEGLAAAKQEIDFLRLSEFDPFIFVNLKFTDCRTLSIILNKNCARFLYLWRALINTLPSSN